MKKDINNQEWRIKNCYNITYPPFLNNDLTEEQRAILGATLKDGAYGRQLGLKGRRCELAMLCLIGSITFEEFSNAFQIRKVHIDDINIF